MHQNMSTCIPTNPSPDRHGQDEKRIPYDAGMYVFEFAQCEMIDDIIPDGIFLFLEFWNVSLDNFIKHNALVMPSFSSRRIAALFFNFDLSDLSLIIVTFYWIFRNLEFSTFVSETTVVNLKSDITRNLQVFISIYSGVPTLFVGL